MESYTKTGLSLFFCVKAKHKIEIQHIKSKKGSEILIYCFIDTEFNATDYVSQNNGYQEITEIGAVVFNNGKIIDTFSRYCLIREDHQLSQRSQRITGITKSTLLKNGIPFLQAINELNNFFEKHNIKRAYAFGPADAIEMRATAKLNNAEPYIYNIIKKVKDVYPIFQSRLKLHYAFSLSDICRICNVQHTKAHSALEDAKDTGYAFHNMKSNKIDKDLLNEINVHKFNIHVYNQSRNVQMATIKKPAVVTPEFIEILEMVFDNAKNKVNTPKLTAIHDDMMRLMGRPDLEIGTDVL